MIDKLEEIKKSLRENGFELTTKTTEGFAVFEKTSEYESIDEF